MSMLQALLINLMKNSHSFIHRNNYLKNYSLLQSFCFIFTCATPHVDEAKKLLFDKIYSFPAIDYYLCCIITVISH